MRAIALGLLLAVACDKGGPTREEVARQKAEAEAADAIKKANDATAQLEAMSKALDDLDKKLETAVEQVVDAQNDADRAAAKAKLEELQREKADMKKRFEELRGQAKGLHLRGECEGNPLAKGC